LYDYDHEFKVTFSISRVNGKLTPVKVTRYTMPQKGREHFKLTGFKCTNGYIMMLTFWMYEMCKYCVKKVYFYGFKDWKMLIKGKYSNNFVLFWIFIHQFTLNSIPVQSRHQFTLNSIPVQSRHQFTLNSIPVQSRHQFTLNSSRLNRDRI
jgi:hypothetical protein